MGFLFQKEIEIREELSAANKKIEASTGHRAQLKPSTSIETAFTGFTSRLFVSVVPDAFLQPQTSSALLPLPNRVRQMRFRTH